MKTDWRELEPYRWNDGPLGSSPTGATYGAFRWVKGGTQYNVIAADGEETGWEHVSITVAYRSGRRIVARMPTWDEMCWLKRQFWNEEEAVIQLHPPKSEYVNDHATCLHLWKCVGENFPLPNSMMVGNKPSPLVNLAQS